jgi:uracil-DNA glycosylase family 4
MVKGDYVVEEQINGEAILVPFENTKGGESLKLVFESLNVDTSKLFFMNTVNCWPHKKMGDKIMKRTPLKTEVQNCVPFVKYAIEVVQPRVIILLGSVASNLFYKEAITKARGNWIEVMGIQAMLTYHPGYFAEIEGKKDEDSIYQAKCEFYDDIKRAFQFVLEHFPEDNILTAPWED